MKPDYEKICGHVQEIALEAGEFIAREREVFSSSAVEYKDGAHNMVSYVDKGAETIIVEALRRLLPGSGFITEEGTATAKDEEYKWIIDPLDGTTNFIHGLPPYCVSIALMEGEELVVGVVYEVTLKEMYYAWKGSGAYMNGRPIRISDVALMDHALIAVGFSYSSVTGDDGYLERIIDYQHRSHGVRRLGSATADAVYVACGRLDAFVQSGLAPWDIAAATLIIRCAGGVVSDYSAGEDFLFGGEFLATTPGLHDQFLSSLK
jgi:myo-inositol-1(or 4)-monophosphatase